MKRVKAIEVMDALVAAGYNVNLNAHYIGDKWAGPDIDDNTKARYSVGISEISIDKIDVRALVEIADKLNVDVGWTPVRGSGLTFGDSERPVPEVVSPRRHPKRTVTTNKAKKRAT